MQISNLIRAMIAGSLLLGWPALNRADVPPEPAAENIAADVEPAADETADNAAPGENAGDPRAGDLAPDTAAGPDATAPDAAPEAAPDIAPDAAEAPAPEPNDKPADKTPEQQAEELFSQGRDALLRSRFDEAIQRLARAVELDKTKTGYRLHLARAYRYAGRTGEAVAELEEIVKTTPDHVEAAQDLATVHAAAEDWQDVVRVLEPLLKYRRDYSTFHLLAEAHHHLDRHDKARGYYEQAIRLNPRSAADHYQLGNLYLAENLFARAADMYQAALRLGIDTPVLRYQLGSAYFNLRNYFGAISVQTITSGQADTIHESWYLIEPLPGRKNTFRCAPENSAIYQVARAMADGLENRPDIHVLKATLYLNARRYARAYEMFTAIQPAVKEDLALFHYYYAQAAFGSGEYDRYLELLEEAIRLDPDAYVSTRVDAYLAVADQHNQQGELEKYIEFLVRAVDESPATASLHLRLGNAYEESQQFARAVVAWRMVLDLEPSHPQRLHLLNQIAKYRTR